MQKFFQTMLIAAVVLAVRLPASVQAAPDCLRDTVIRADATWSGEVRIEGVVVVGRPATLTIEPGTVIRFVRRDSDRDGVGDSEIRVLGRLLANGTAQRPIRFQSAAETPRTGDWSYVLFFTSSGRNRVSHCRFRHAFTGVQVHFSTATVVDCLFENNREGLRFGRADLQVEHNTFRANDVGIRFTRMEGPARIRHNVITGNRLGIFLVPSGQNIRDFFDPDQSGTPWNTGRLLITANNIHDNSWYNLNLGEKQQWDLDAAGNWWGTTDPDEIRKKIFDAGRDPSLGRVLLSPLAEKPIAGAGRRTGGP